MKNLRFKMIATIVAVVLLSSGLLLLISYLRARESLSTQLESTYSMAADKYAQELTGWLDRHATLIDTMAAEIGQSGIWKEGYDAFHGYLESSFSIYNKNGTFYDIYFTYPDNSMACASDFIPDGSLDYAHERLWFTTAAETDSLYYSTPYKDSDSGQAIITISRAVYAEGALQGVLAADIFVDTLVKTVSEADVARNSYAFLMDQNLEMIVHPNPAYDFEDEPRGVMDVPDVPYAKVIDNIRTDTRQTVYVRDYDGIERGIVISKMPSTGWYVGIATARAELMRGVGSLARGFIIAAISAVVIAVMVSAFLAYVLGKFSQQEQEHEAQVLKLEKQAADEASEAKSRFLADMSHEIRTPINAVLGMNEMILRESHRARANAEGVDPEAAEAFDCIRICAGNIQSAGGNLLSIINDILDFSKIEAGRMDIVDAPYTFSSLLNDVSSMVAFRVKEKGLKYIVDVDEGLPDGLYGDKVRVRQAVTNILNNAVKYTDHGSVRMTVRGRADDGIAPGRMIELTITVQDTGIGIKPEDIDKLFTEFQRVDLTHNSTVEGTGLGLAITRGLLKMMGGSISVESEYGSGSAFTIVLPQKIVSCEPVGDYQERFEKGVLATKAYEESFHAPDARILIVDDTRMNLIVAVGLLKHTQLQIDTANSGMQAIALAQKQAYDLILMDQRMPEMDGTQALVRIRSAADGMNRETPIICMTADAIIGAKERYMSEGFTDYLPKPIDSHALEQMIMKYLPADKVIRGTTEAGKSAASVLPNALSEDFAPLKQAGIDPSAGLDHCQGDGNMYRSLLWEYAHSAEEKIRDIERYYEARDWKNYSILVHAVKSSSMMIGAPVLANAAARLETRADEGRVSDIEGENASMLRQYTLAADAIHAILPDDDPIANEWINAGDAVGDDIIEFMPESDERG